ncbi:hypothetical protein E7T09_08535 [Deinococcus sp. KSM4-11]|uniref:hypothetical protein n=1 Tax=Deinococcus sp. KSM4-11 TaxID=2568654 RepID=UPI0010A2D8CF|nr:hypothetical protein [Deinococcus sp. KSM4-11]THF87192.1 hypothetical protein E7T09_08535 [Deinococcus sp. KSM4-11]
MIEADADLIKEHGEETDDPVTDWRRFGLLNWVSYGTNHVTGPRHTGQQDTITLPTEATFQ